MLLNLQLLIASDGICCLDKLYDSFNCGVYTFCFVEELDIYGMADTLAVDS